MAQALAQGCHVVRPRTAGARVPMFGLSPRRRLTVVWVSRLIFGAYGSTAAGDAPADAVFAPTSMSVVPSHLSNFQLQAELGISAFAPDSTSQSRVADSFGSHLPTFEKVLASSYGYSMVRVTGISLTAEHICARFEEAKPS
ncbi:unnamed protein product [Prorocentrum cordatum]|uniref:Uncharacterized protein n=1 Tax=Prorocentrum cordatum TaxID=2364126 RepID=A0ABN9VEM8_9DINO|nr:unnamed protein product [Polarella glacialis]